MALRLARPRTIVAIVTAAFAAFFFLILNVATGRNHSESALKEGGNYYVKGLGQPIHQISYSQYQQYRAWDIRGLASAWIIFSVIAFVLSYRLLATKQEK